MEKRKYNQGAKARDSFEKTMAALFQVKKAELKDKPKSGPRHPKKGKH